MKYFLSVIAFSLVVFLAVPAFAEESNASFGANQFRIGVGGGIPYGGWGVNGEYRFNKYVSASAGLGVWKHESPGFAVGAMFYPFKNDGWISPRFSAYFGRVSTYDWGNPTGHTYRAVYGGAVGPGFEWRIYKRLTFGLDLFYLAKNAPNGYRHGIDASAGFGITF